MAFNYSVAIKLSVANLASQGVRMLAADLIKAHGAAVNLQGKLSALKMAAAGLAISKAGDGILGFLGKSIEASKEYTHQIALMKAAGFTQKEVADSVASAWKTTGEVITTSAQDNLKAIRELRTAFGRGEGMGHAYAVLPQVTRIEGILQSLTGKKQEGVAFDMVKAIEFSTKGAISVQNMSKQAEMMAKSLVAFNGTLTVSDFHSAFKQMASAAAYLSDEFKYTVAPTIMQEFKTATGGGAQRAGTALATLFGLIKGQRIAPKNIQNWIDSGLISESMVIRNPHSRTMSKLMPNAIAGANLFTEHPEQFAEKYLVPAMAKFKAKHKGADDLAFYYSLTGDRWSAFMMQTLVNKAQQIKRDQELIAQVGSSYTSYNKLLKTDPMLAQQALQNQWQNMQAIIGYQILPALIPAITRFAKSMAELNTWMSKNPDKLRNLVVGLAGLGLALSVLGKVLMGIAFFKFVGALPLLGRSVGLFFQGLSMLLFPFRFLAGLLPMLVRGLGMLLFTIGPRQIGIIGYALRGVMLLVRGLGMLLFTIGPRQIGIIGYALRGVMLLVRGLGMLLFTIGPRQIGIVGYLARGLMLVGRGFVGLLVGMGPIGWTLLAIGAAALLVWNNWKEIWGNLKIMFGDMVTGFKQLFSGDILGALGSFTAVFLRGWQTIFNTLIAGLNTVLPQAWQISKMHFADDFDAWRNGKAAVPTRNGQTVQVQTNVHMDGRKVAEAVSTHQARAAGRPSASSGRFDAGRAQPFVAMGAMR